MFSLKINGKMPIHFAGDRISYIIHKVQVWVLL